MFFRFSDGDNIDYNAFLAGINWFDNPAPPIKPEDTLQVRKKHNRNIKSESSRKEGRENILAES